jgi:hypothetical protein
MKLYVAGPMRGHPLYNFPAFDAAAEILEAAGHEVVNPAELDRQIGFDPAGRGEISNKFLRDAMKRDLTAICECDGIAMLPGWEGSSGAYVEWTLARNLGLEIIYLPDEDAETD